MRQRHWQIFLGISLLVLSGLVYGVHYLLFRDAHHIFVFLVSDVAFVFVEVLLVTLIIHGVLEQREKRARLRKLNIVIGTFFSEAGTGLLRILSRHDPAMQGLQEELLGGKGSADEAFGRIVASLRTEEIRIEAEALDWEELRSFLTGRRDFLLRLLENSNLLEHETFTDLLWAVFHLGEELEFREELRVLPLSDRRHLGGDATRAYRQLALQWLAYMDHLKESYPYLFSLAARTNPFNRSASPIVAS